MRRLLISLLALWAATASILAAHFHAREVPRTRIPPGQRGPVDHERTRHLSRRVTQLETALAAAFEPPAPGVDDPPIEDRISSLLEQERRMIEMERVSTADLFEVQRKLQALLASDADSHLVLMELLGASRSEAEAEDILSYLTESPFTRLVRADSVTARLLEEARSLLTTGPSPHLRSAAARVLYGYEPPRKDDVLFGLEQLNAEPDDGVRDELLSEITARARGVALTVDEARPLLLRLRENVRAGRAWCANALARWSAEPADYDLVKASFLAETDPRQLQLYLNAFRRDTRLGASNVDESLALLLRTMEDSSAHANTRSLACHLLEGYAPWDRVTADAVRRYRAGEDGR